MTLMNTVNAVGWAKKIGESPPETNRKGPLEQAEDQLRAAVAIVRSQLARTHPGVRPIVIEGLLEGGMLVEHEGRLCLVIYEDD